MISGLAKWASGVRAVDEILLLVKDKLGELVAVQILQGQLTPEFSVASSGTKQLSHGLSRAPVGWIPISKTANVNLWNAAPPDKLRLFLGASVSARVRLWVF